VADWHQRAGQQAKQVHEHLIAGRTTPIPRAEQADEVRVKTQRRFQQGAFNRGGVLWMAVLILPCYR